MIDARIAELNEEYDDLDRKEKALKCALSPEELDGVDDLLDEFGGDISDRQLIVNNIYDAIDKGGITALIREIRNQLDQEECGDRRACAAI